MSNRSSNKKPEGNKSQDKDIKSFESTIRRDKKEVKSKQNWPDKKESKDNNTES
jgi:hypothetical protein